MTDDDFGAESAGKLRARRKLPFSRNNSFTARSRYVFGDLPPLAIIIVTGPRHPNNKSILRLEKQAITAMISLNSYRLFAAHRDYTL